MPEKYGFAALRKLWSRNDGQLRQIKKALKTIKLLPFVFRVFEVSS